MSAYLYDEDVALRYDAAVPVRPGEAEFYLGLAQEAESRGLRTLELACGTGRIAVPLAQKGVRILGLDYSQAMLARAREKSGGLENAQWAEGDMRSFELGESFGLITIPAGSFQLLLETDDQLDSLRCVGKHLAPDGRLAFEVENLDIVRMAEWLTHRRGTLQRRPHRDYIHPVTGRQVYSSGTVDYHPFEQRRVDHSLIEEIDERGEVVSRLYRQSMEVRYLHRFETEHLLARCGLAVEALYGNFDKSEYQGQSPIMLWVARRAEA